ncbi:MAG TPA: TlpA disulfide reductase family protein [Pirellulales bacterium]
MIRRDSQPLSWAGIVGNARWRVVAWLLGCASIAAPLGAAHADEAADGASTSAVLRLKDRDFGMGRLIDSPAGDVLVWQSAAFASPLRFPINKVRSVHFPVTDRTLQPQGEYCFELAGGDTLFGTLVELNGPEAVIDSPALGKLHIDRSVLRRIHRWNTGDLIYSGPNGLEGWKTSGSAGAWREDGGHLVADEIGAVIRRDFKVPAMARFEVELAWNKKADFDLAFGVGEDPKSVLRAFRFDVWDNKIVAWRETEREADVTALAKIEPGPGHMHLQALVDQENGRMLVLSAAGEKLADLKVSTAKPQAFGGLQLTNKSGDVRLERLRIGNWNGEIPQPVAADKARIHAADGAIIYGQLESYDSANHQFVIRGDAGEQRFGEDQVQDVFLSESNPVGDRALAALYTAGTRISGDLMRVEQSKIWIKSPGIREPVAAPVEALHALVMASRTTEPIALSGREGRLELTGVLLYGCLVDSTQRKRASGQGGEEAVVEGSGNCLIWQPREGGESSPLAPDVTGRIVYRDRPVAPKAPPRKSARVVAGAAPLVARGGLRSAAPASDDEPNRSGPQPSKTESVLHLRYGDTIPCTVTSTDEKGITLQTSVTDTTFVSHDQIQALELMPEAASTTIAKQKKERLLTLPRMQRDNPPTQLIRSIDGDYLRGRLVSMDATQLQVEIRLDTKAIPRDSVVRIIWLHPETGAPGGPAGEAAARHAGTRVQALQNDGNRLTFYADRFEGSILSGTSDLLGNCRVDVARIDELLLGAAIEQSAATLAFHQWKLTPAADPLASPDGEEGEGGAEGLESALVGKPAPEFQLDMLDGTRFNLADRKNTVVVLDFWASWCGPCLQVMPQVDKVAEEFAAEGVQLVAINLEETPDRVTAALERLHLDMPVALDRNGRVAEKYGATSIPQTVVIGRDGKVARLFVGASARFDEQLRTALRAVLAGDTEKKE